MFALVRRVVLMRPGCLFLVLLVTVTAGCGIVPDEERSSYVRWSEPITVATGGTTVGPWRMNRSTWEYVDNPVADLTEDRIGIAWVDQRRRDVLLQSYGRDGRSLLEEPVNVSRSPDVFSWYPDIIVDESRSPASVYVLWQEIVFSGGSHGGEIFFARSTDAGRSFESPVNLSNSEEGDGKGRQDREHWENGSLDLTQGPAGNLYAVWTEYEGVLWLSRSEDRGATFSDPVRVGGAKDNRPARAPSVAVGPEGQVAVVWAVGEDTTADIHLRTLDRDGVLSGPPRVVHESSGHSDAPKLAVDGSGSLHVAYAESPDGPDNSYHIRYARAKGESAAFEPPRVLKASSTEGVESYHYPSLDLDEAGDPYLVWELFPNEQVPRSRGLGLIASEEGEGSFGPPEAVLGTLSEKLGFNGGLQGKLTDKLDVEDGRVAVVHSTFNPGEESRVLLYVGSIRTR